MRNNIKQIFLCGLVSLTVTGCGSVSKLVGPSREMPDLHPYSRVVVTNFEDKTAKIINTEEKMQAFKEKVQSASVNLADRIATELRKTKAFDEVLRQIPEQIESDTLVINGAITRYEEGNATARLLIGMGMGSAYFDATVRLEKGRDNQPLGELKVDKNSWWLGGGIASGQNVESFMQLAAERLAQEMVKAKQGEKSAMARVK